MGTYRNRQEAKADLAEVESILVLSRVFICVFVCAVLTGLKRARLSNFAIIRNTTTNNNNNNQFFPQTLTLIV